MNETIAFRPEGRASIKDVVVNYTLASLDELEQLHPALNLLAHNRLCDLASQFCAGMADVDSETRSGFYTVRSISLPVYRRLLRDQHSHGVCLQQALLHLLAWKSDSPWARQQAQRLLWQGGVLGDKGEFALMTLDDELRERQIGWPGLWSLLAVTGFLAKFPAGPIFAD
ncbi:hypothetical protein A7G03_06345 [Salmonella enterica]|nr:hypothetical protein [Salmonella enterica]